MKTAFKRALWLPVMVVTLSASYCKDDDTSDATGSEPFVTEDELLLGSWRSDCIENNSTSDETLGENGFYNETFTFAENTATQTYTYYQDANCTFPVENQLITDGEIPIGQSIEPPTTDEIGVDEVEFVATITRLMDLTLSSGTTPTDLGPATHIDLETTSITINDLPLTEEQMQGFGIALDPEQESVLEAFIGIYLVSDNDQLHLSLVQKADPAELGSETLRPTNISLGSYYTRLDTESISDSE